jgi:secreted PhoX family phosphatase
MDAIGRRRFLQAAAAATGGLLVTNPFEALAAAAAPAVTLEPVEDLRDGVVRLHLPKGFRYRSFHDTEQPTTLDDGTALPGRHDGMGAFRGPFGAVWLVRNHEVNGPGAAFGPGDPYDKQTKSGTTTCLVTGRGEVLQAFTSLNGTQMNCSGGRTTWGSWITCEETVNGPDVGPDFTNASNVTLEQPHGYIFEVPAGGQSNRQPLRSAGRFAHEAAAWDSRHGVLYLTEDNFGFPSGLYRYIPPEDPDAIGHLVEGGPLQMLRVKGQDNVDLAMHQEQDATYDVEWVTIPEPDPTFTYTPGQPAPTTNNDALNFVGNQGREQGAAYFSRLEGATFSRRFVYFSSTQGGGAQEASFGPIADGYGNGSGQVWEYDTRDDRLRCVFQSPGPDVLDFPDNVTVREDGGPVVLCEDNTNDNYVRGLTRRGELFPIALNRLRSSLTGNADRSGDEFAGATFSPNGRTLFVNIQAAAGMTFAIWGPWDRLGV